MHATLEKGWLAGLVSKDVLESVCVCVLGLIVLRH